MIGFSFLCAELQTAIFKLMSIETIASLIQSGHAGARDVSGVHERTIFLGMIKSDIFGLILILLRLIRF